MTDTERVIEAVVDEFACAGEDCDCHNRPLTTALVNLAMSGVCPECHERSRSEVTIWDDDGWTNRCKECGGKYPDRHKAGCRYTGMETAPCPHPYHDHREALDALLAERGGDSR